MYRPCKVTTTCYMYTYASIQIRSTRHTWMHLDLESKVTLATANVAGLLIFFFYRLHVIHPYGIISI